MTFVTDYISKLSHRTVLLALAVGVLLVYANALFNGFVYDDGYLIVRNPYIKDFSHLKEILLSDVTKTSPYGSASGYYRPLSMLFLMVGFKFMGLNPLPWHLCNVLLHLANVWLVHSIVNRLLKNRVAAFWSALLFAVHPVHVEAVTPVYNFMGVLSTFFGLSAFVAFMRIGEQRRALALCVVSLLMGLFSKEDGIVWPVILVLYDCYFRTGFHVRKFFARWRIYACFAAVIGFYLFMRLLAVEQRAALGLWDLGLTFNVSAATSAWGHVLTVFKVYSLYLAILAFPWNLSAFHTIEAVSGWADPQGVGSALMIGGLIVCAVLTRRRSREVSFFIMMFLIAVLPVSNIVPIGGLFAERLVYFPSVAFCALAGIWAAKVSGRHRAGVIVVAAVVLFMSLKTIERNYVWRNNIVLWQVTATQSPQNAIVRINLAEAYSDAGLWEEAIAEYQKALTTGSFKSFQVHNAIGKIYGRRGDFDGAIKEFSDAIKLNDNFSEGLYNLGISYFHKGDLSHAELYFKKGLEKDPQSPWNYYGLGLVYERRENLDQAVAMFLKAHRKDPDHRWAIEGLERMVR